MTVTSNIVCPDCAAINRVPDGRDARKAGCGRCKQPLFNGRPVDVDSRMFDRQTTLGSLPVLVDIWAPWCGPCRIMAPAFESAAPRLEPRVRLLKLNADENQPIVERLNIRGIPALILFQGGKELARMSGALTTSQIVEWAEKQLG